MSVRHIVERAHERYGLVLTYKDVSALARQINTGQAKPTRAMSMLENSSAWLCTLNGRELLVLTFPSRRRPGSHVINTVYPMDLEIRDGFRLGDVLGEG